VHDDQVDALGLIGQLLDRVRPGQIAQDETAKPEHLVLEAHGDGRVTANMSVREIVEMKMKRREGG
jgi:hypothetical protein